MVRKIGVGIIGVTPGSDWKTAGWANVAHIPALTALPEYEIQAVCSRSRASAESVARTHDIPHVFDDAKDLAECSAVDLVVVTVRVPAHLHLVRTALTAGKAVYCEWPLGNGFAEAEELAALARERNIRCAVGLQGRGSPVVNYVRDLVADGYVGEVLSTSMIGSGMNWGPGMPKRNLYTLDKANGATLLSIAAGAALDALCYCLGEFAELNAVTALRRRTMSFPDDDVRYPVTAEDQWIVSGTLENGAVASVHYRGGSVPGQNFIWEINGSQGDLRVTSDFGALHVFNLTLSGARGGDAMTELPIPKKYQMTPPLPDPVLNVANVYARYADDIRNHGRNCPDFEDAVIRHRMLEAIERAAETGCKQHYN